MTSGRWAMLGGCGLGLLALVVWGLWGRPAPAPAPGGVSAVIDQTATTPLAALGGQGGTPPAPAASGAATAPGAAPDAPPAADTEATTAPGVAAEVPAAPPPPDAAVAAADPGAAVAPLDLPVFQIVRVAPDGQTVIAGRARPGVEVEVLLDSAVIGTAQADAAGEFVAVVAASPSDVARALVLRARVEAPPDPVADAPPPGESATPAATAPAATAPAAPTAPAAEATPAPAAADPATTDVPPPPVAADPATADATPPLAVADPAAAEATPPPVAADPATADTLPVAAAPTAAPADAGAPAADAEAVSAATAQGAGVAPVAETVPDAAAVDPAAPQVLAAAPALPQPDPGYALSAPVIILPGAGAAPVVVQPGPDGVTLVQPQAADPAAALVLDQVSRAPDGAVTLAGRGAPGATLRCYANGVAVAQTRIGPGGDWRTQVAAAAAKGALLLRLDALGPDGAVLARLETPFDDTDLAAALAPRPSALVVQRGDNLWRLAEQVYGEGTRYSVIFGANAGLIRDPDLIYPGQVFALPDPAPAP